MDYRNFGLSSKSSCFQIAIRKIYRTIAELNVSLM